MFDYHIHTRISFDSQESPENVIRAAEVRGLREICFTDHYDFYSSRDGESCIFAPETYRENLLHLHSDTVKIRRGVEFGLTTWNQEDIVKLENELGFDFIIGSVHSIDGIDPYLPEYWEGCDEPFLKYLKEELECVKLHRNFDVFGHINYVCKSPYNATKKPLYYGDYADICDEIMKTLAENGRGMEINTSGIPAVGVTLPNIDFIRRFKELGGEIVTVGSDSHSAERIGDGIDRALEIAKEVFGYVCTFEGRKPIFHKL